MGRCMPWLLIAVMFTLHAASMGPIAFAARPEVRALSVEGNESQARVRIRGAFKVPRYSVRARDLGKTVVIEVEGASLPKSGVVTKGSARLVHLAPPALLTIAVCASSWPSRIAARYRVVAEPGKITVLLNRNGRRSGKRRREHARSASRPLKKGKVELRDAHLESRDGRPRLVIQLSHPAPFRMSPEKQGPARLEVLNARLSPKATKVLEWREDQAQGEPPLGKITFRQQGGHVVVEAERAAGVTATAIREGRRLVWLFSPAKVGDRRPRSTTVARERDYREPSDDEATEIESPKTAAFLSDIPLQLRRVSSRRRFRGRRIDLDFNNADIHNILRLLAEVGGVNIVTSDDVSGAVTIRMTNVPWDQALQVILQAKGLGMVRRANLIRVAPLEALEKERELAIARQKQQVELAPLETRLVPVSYAQAKELQNRAKELLTERGSVSVDERTNILIVRDVVDALEDVEALVRTLDTQTPQVLVEARIVEATSQYSRDIGIQWGGDVTLNTATGNPTGLVFPANVGVTGGNFDQQSPTQGLSPFTGNVATPNFAVNLPAATGTGQGGALGLTLGSLGGAVNLGVRLSAAEASGVIRIVSSPRILTLDNSEAHIAQGTLIPYSQVSAQGVQTAFQEAKLELRVRPHVTSDGSVSMHVKVTRDEPDFTRTSARGDPTILKREAETDLLVDDAHTAVIGGIYTRNTSRNVDQVPFFGDIPIIGVLFQRRRSRDERGELLIFLTPRIVNRSRALQR